MKVILENTDRIVELVMPDGAIVPARIWEGTTENGIACHAYITRISVRDNLDASEFERDLREVKPASGALDVIPSRLVL